MEDIAESNHSENRNCSSSGRMNPITTPGCAQQYGDHLEVQNSINCRPRRNLMRKKCICCSSTSVKNDVSKTTCSPPAPLKESSLPPTSVAKDVILGTTCSPLDTLQNSLLLSTSGKRESSLPSRSRKKNDISKAACSSSAPLQKSFLPETYVKKKSLLPSCATNDVIPETTCIQQKVPRASRRKRDDGNKGRCELSALGFKECSSCRSRSAIMKGRRKKTKPILIVRAPKIDVSKFEKTPDGKYVWDEKAEKKFFDMYIKNGKSQNCAKKLNESKPPLSSVTREMPRAVQNERDSRASESSDESCPLTVASKFLTAIKVEHFFTNNKLYYRLEKKSHQQEQNKKILSVRIQKLNVDNLVKTSEGKFLWDKKNECLAMLTKKSRFSGKLNRNMFKRRPNDKYISYLKNKSFYSSNKKSQVSTEKAVKEVLKSKAKKKSSTGVGKEIPYELDQKPVMDTIRNRPKESCKAEELGNVPVSEPLMIKPRMRETEEQSPELERYASTSVVNNKQPFEPVAGPSGLGNRFGGGHSRSVQGNSCDVLNSSDDEYDDSASRNQQSLVPVTEDSSSVLGELEKELTPLQSIFLPGLQRFREMRRNPQIYDRLTKKIMTVEEIEEVIHSTGFLHLLQDKDFLYLTGQRDKMKQGVFTDPPDSSDDEEWDESTFGIHPKTQELLNCCSESQIVMKVNVGPYVLIPKYIKSEKKVKAYLKKNQITLLRLIVEKDEPFAEIFHRIADMLNWRACDVCLFLYDQVVNINSTPYQLCVTSDYPLYCVKWDFSNESVNPCISSNYLAIIVKSIRPKKENAYIHRHLSPLSALMQRYSADIGIPLDRMVFTYEGKVLDPEKYSYNLGMPDMAVVDVMITRH